MLHEHGFRRVQAPNGWMSPTLLYESGGRWFGASWDWRDGYLGADLGQLRRFADVMPRVIVRGPYRHHVECRDVEGELAAMRKALPDALNHYDSVLTRILDPTPTTKKGRQIDREYSSRLGDVVEMSSWPGAKYA